ncbi:MAG: GNAT family N-acetyltransferase [Stellaceae bacterium]
MRAKAAPVSSNLLRLPRIFAGAEPPTTRLVGQRVTLRPPIREDYEEWSRLREASRRFLTPWEPSWSLDALSRAAFRQRMFHYAAEWRSGQGYNFFLFRNSDRTLLGGIGLSQIRRGVAESGSLGYWMGERHAGQGHMTEALALALGFAFGRLRLHRIEAACLPHNKASRTVLTKNGLREEGYAKEYLCIDGRWQDHVLFAILYDEWANRLGHGG